MAIYGPWGLEIGRFGGMILAFFSFSRCVTFYCDGWLAVSWSLVCCNNTSELWSASAMIGNMHIYLGQF